MSQKEPSKESLASHSDNEVEQALGVLSSRDVVTTLKDFLDSESFIGIKKLLMKKADEQFVADRHAELDQPLSAEEMKDFIALMRAEAQDLIEANPEPEGRGGTDGDWGTATMERRDYQEAKANVGALNRVSYSLEQGESLDTLLETTDQAMEERRSGDTGKNMVKESLFEKRHGLTMASGRGGDMYIAEQKAYAYADMLKNDPAAVRRKLAQSKRAAQAEVSSTEEQADLAA